MDKHKKLTLAELMAKAEQRKAAKPVFGEGYVPALEGCLVLQKLPVSRFSDIMGRYDASDFGQAVQQQIELVYASCPYLQDKGLQEAYGVQEPTDIVMVMLNDDLGTLASLTAVVMGFYGLGEADEELKN